ncbi:MAG: hypothetical protein ACKOEO_13955 [Planctomycetaceae bacterium]
MQIVIAVAKSAEALTSGAEVDHFVDANKMVSDGGGPETFLAIWALEITMFLKFCQLMASGLRGSTNGQ